MLISCSLALIAVRSGLSAASSSFQINPLHLKIGAAANLRLAKICFLLANRGGLFVRDADLLPNGRIVQHARETGVPVSAAAVAVRSHRADGPIRLDSRPSPSAAA